MNPAVGLCVLYICLCTQLDISIYVLYSCIFFVSSVLCLCARVWEAKPPCNLHPFLLLLSTDLKSRNSLSFILI